ncbi:unnamed protein product [Calypogeia fissa]
MAYILPLAVGVVAAVFLLIVSGELFYLFYWRKRAHFPRGSHVSVAPVSEGEAATVTEPAETPEVVINVTCAEYQIAALHQDLVEKLFPAMGVTSREVAQDLMGPTRMLFTITEETKEDLEKLDLDGKRNRRASRSKSMSDFSVSPGGPLSPLASPFITPPSSPEHFITPYGTPTYSPLVTVSRPPNHSATTGILETSQSPCRITNDHPNGVPPVGPPSPTRPTFPFLPRGSSPSKSPDIPSSMLLDTSDWCSPNSHSNGHSNGNKLSPGIPFSAFYSPPRKPFIFATPMIHGKQVEGLKGASPLRSCTYVYENGTFSPSASPQRCPPSPLFCTLGDHFARENQWRSNLSTTVSTPPQLSPTSPGPCTPFFNHSTPPSETGFANSQSCKPASQRSSAMLFPSSLSRPPLAPLLTDRSPTASFPGTGSSSPTDSTASLSQSSWESMSTPFIVEPSSSSAH